MLYFLILCAVILAAVLLRSHYENTHFTRAYYLDCVPVGSARKCIWQGESGTGRCYKAGKSRLHSAGRGSDYRKGEETQDRAGISFPDTDQRYLSGLLYLWKSRNQRKGAGWMEGLYQPG